MVNLRIKVASFEWYFINSWVNQKSFNFGQLYITMQHNKRDIYVHESLPVCLLVYARVYWCKLNLLCAVHYKRSRFLRDLKIRRDFLFDKCHIRTTLRAKTKVLHPEAYMIHNLFLPQHNLWELLRSNKLNFLGMPRHN